MGYLVCSLKNYITLISFHHRLVTCSLTEGSGPFIGALLKSQTLKELTLTNNNLKDAGVEQLFSRGLASPDCKLEKLM